MLYGLVEKNYTEQFTGWISKEVNNYLGVCPLTLRAFSAVGFRRTPNRNN
jgi:hypothetical protein